jgi:hypothetical protein
LVLVGLVGCASPEAPPFKTGGVAVEGNSVYFTHSRMDFGTTSVRMPTSLLVNSVELLHPPNDCGSPALAGIGLLPAAAAIGDVPDGMTSAFDVVWSGAVAARIRVSYSVPYQCGSVTSSLGGTSTFTFFDNDRVVRVDEGLQSNTSGQALAGPTSCACASADPFRFQSFWALASGEVYDKTFTKGTVTDATACIPIDTVMIGARYKSAGMIAETRGYPVIRDQFGVEQANSWPASVPAVERSVSQLVVLPRDESDQMACAKAAAIIEDYPPIVLNGSEMVLPDENGIYVATRQYEETLTISTNARDMPSSFVLDVDMGRTNHLKVTDDFGDTQYNVQAMGSRLLLSLPAISRTDRSRVSIEPLD